MTVPLMDASGQVIGFTGRIIVDDPKAPKYLNTPQTLIYDKSRHVFGLSQAKEAIRRADFSVIVEGNLDVVSSHQVRRKKRGGVGWDSHDGVAFKGAESA